MREDTFRHKGMRSQMCAELRQKGISDENVLQAMESIPRHWFLDMALDNMAYDDCALPILCDQTISQPSTVALQSQLLKVEKDMMVLEIGTGSGYQTAVLCKMGAKVYTIERQQGLFVRTKQLLYDLRYNAKCFLGDGYRGLSEIDLRRGVPHGEDRQHINREVFDRAIITCGAPFIPTQIMMQLKIGGILVIPISGGNGSPIKDEEGVSNKQGGQMVRVTKNGEDKSQWTFEQWGDCRFVPMLEGRQF